jgi:signal transduction histidine kinase/ActR/RegA family two-component response regulator
MELADERRIAHAVHRAGMALTADLELEGIVQTLTDEATTLCRAEFGSFFYNVIDARGEAFMLYTLSGAPKEAFARFPLPRATPIFSTTFKGEGIVRSDDIRKDPRYGAMGPQPAGHLPVVSYLAVPVISRTGEVLGGLFFGHKEAGVFTERDEGAIKIMAQQAAIAIDNARLFAKVKALEIAEKAARAQAEEASRLKDEFLAVVSHELRTPLSAMLGWLRMLDAGLVDEDRRTKALGTISRSADALHQLVDDLLDVSRAISGKLRIDVQPLDLVDVVKSAIEAVRAAADAKSITVTTELDPAATSFVGDAGRIRQVVWNLVNNAVKFTPRGGHVSVMLRREAENDGVEIKVVDNGRGISPAHLPHVFDRFRQGQSGTTREHGGLGLGLAIVKSLVELHGGTVTAESGGEEQGSTFRVRFPIGELRAMTPAVSERGKVRVPDNVRGLRVLVVDDDRDATELLAELLGGYGVRPLVASSAAEAMEVLQRERPDALVSDIGMPGEDGYSLIGRIRKLTDESLATIPAMAVTAFARKEERAKALWSGFDHHLPKPVDPNELFAVLGSITQYRRRSVLDG